MQAVKLYLFNRRFDCTFATTTCMGLCTVFAYTWFSRDAKGSDMWCLHLDRYGLEWCWELRHDNGPWTFAVLIKLSRWVFEKVRYIEYIDSVFWAVISHRVKLVLSRSFIRSMWIWNIFSVFCVSFCGWYPDEFFQENLQRGHRHAVIVVVENSERNCVWPSCNRTA